MSILQWPFKRKQYTQYQNPRFVSDIVAANEAVLDGLKALTGLGDTDFAIIYGITYNQSTASYSNGIIYLNGSFYYVQNSFNTGVYLVASPLDTLPVAFQDGVSRNIYTVQYAVTSSTQVTGSSPIFTGDMNAYRINLTKLKTDLASVQNIISNLGNASTKNVGTIAGTVAAGDYSYSKSAIDAMIANLAPPLATGTFIIGDPASDWNTYVVPIGTTLQTTDYQVVMTLYGNSGDGNSPQDAAGTLHIISQTTTSFTVFLSMLISNKGQSGMKIKYRIYA